MRSRACKEKSHTGSLYESVYVSPAVFHKNAVTIIIDFCQTQ